MKKIGKILLWVFFFPVMLAIWGLKNSKKAAFFIGAFLTMFMLVGIFGEQESDNPERKNEPIDETVIEKEVAEISETVSEIILEKKEFDALQQLYITVDYDTPLDDVYQLIDGLGLIYSEDDRHGEIDLRIAYTKGAALFKYSDPGDYIQMEFSRLDDNADMKTLAHMSYHPEISLASLIKYSHGTYWDLTEPEQKGLYTSIAGQDKLTVDDMDAQFSWLGEQLGCEYPSTDLGVLSLSQDGDLSTVDNDSDVVDNSENVESENKQPSFDGYTLLTVDGGDLSGHREPNVVVDIGFGDREYYAFTNEYGQLIKVVAEEVVLQDEANEPVNSKGRYYPDEAKVPGTESSTLDEGHVIADSLGGVANAYNITPQNSTLNRHGDQAYMEKVIRDAGGCTDFEAIITYPDTETQIPSHYSFTYTLLGNIITDEFDNVNPDEVNASSNSNTNDINTNSEVNNTNETDNTDATSSATEDDVVSTENSSDSIQISKLDKVAEYIIISNTGQNSVDLTGWRILSVRGEQDYVFPQFTLQPNSTVKVGDSGKGTVDFHWLEGRGVWNNSKSDPAELYDNAGKLVDRLED